MKKQNKNVAAIIDADSDARLQPPLAKSVRMTLLAVGGVVSILGAGPQATAGDAVYQMEPTTGSTGVELLNESAVGSKQFEFGGYFRSGTGWNQGGGRQRCFTNPGAAGSANEFRLGNECSTYGEAALRTHILKAAGSAPDKAAGYTPDKAAGSTPDKAAGSTPDKAAGSAPDKAVGATPDKSAGSAPDEAAALGIETAPYFNAVTTIAYNPNADTQYEAAGGFANGSSLNLIEAYVEGGNFDDLGLSYWAGKRFYRTVDVHMDDFYYFANMSGNGAGIGNLKTHYGVWRAALLQETATSTAGNGTVTHTDTDTAGSLSKTALDIRLENVALSSIDTLHAWFVAATTPPGTDSAGNRYVQGHGYVAALRYNRKVVGNLLGDFDAKRVGSNDLAVEVGTGVMETFEMNGGTSILATDTHERDAMRIRIVEHATLPLTAHLASHIAAIYENRHQTTSSTTKLGGSGYWWDVGVRPVYAFTAHHSLAFEAGHSEVKDDSETVGVRQMTRFTLAPQVAISNNIFGRPVIRAYLTQTLWNDANRTQLVAGSQEYQKSNSATSVGFQTEVWF